MAASPTRTSTPTSKVLHGLFEVHPPPSGTAWLAQRAAVCMAVPILAGWWLGDITAGLMGVLGAFTSMYGRGRPYISRAQHLGLVAVAFAVMVALGMSVPKIGWAVVITVAAVAAVATWLSNALQLGQPGAYLFTLACATGTAISASHLSPVKAALLVFCGGALAWIVHMSGALLAPRGPERKAVASAAQAVIAYINAVGSAQEPAARDRAASALHTASSVVVTQQPIYSRPNRTIARLRALSSELNLRFAEAMGAAGRQQAPPPGLLDQTRALASQAEGKEGSTEVSGNVEALRRPSAFAALAEALQPGSNSLRIIIRVGVAAIAVGSLAAAVHIERAYWAVAAAVLVLHQGFDWPHMVRRSVERTAGTWAGLLLAGAILMVHPQGVWLVLTMMAMQFAVQMLIPSSYALAAIFITGLAFTIVGAGHRLTDPGSYLLARGVDTLAGCLMAMLVFRLIPPLAATPQIPELLVRTLRAVDAVVEHASRGSVITPAAKKARKELQWACFALAHGYEDSRGATPCQRHTAEQMCPATAATERLAYRTLSMCWQMEQHGDFVPSDFAASISADDRARVHATLEDYIACIRNNTKPSRPGPLPKMLESDLLHLYECLVREPQAVPALRAAAT